MLGRLLRLLAALHALRESRLARCLVRLLGWLLVLIGMWHAACSPWKADVPEPRPKPRRPILDRLFPDRRADQVPDAIPRNP